MRENKPNLDRIENSNVKNLLGKLLDKDPTVRPTAGEILDYPWLINVRKKERCNTPG